MTLENNLQQMFFAPFPELQHGFSTWSLNYSSLNVLINYYAPACTKTLLAIAAVQTLPTAYFCLLVSLSKGHTDIRL